MRITSVVMAIAASLLLCPVWANEIVVKGLFKNGAVLEINGKQRLLRAGASTPEGITLLSADAQKAVLEINGKAQTFYLSDQIGARYKAPERKIVRIPSSQGNHYRALGAINGKRVRFLVDTGATSVALSSYKADELGIDYRDGAKGAASTAGGIVNTYNVMLDEVSVGDITIPHVRAAVIEGRHPSEILLGNTFLSLLDLKVENGVLVLQEKF